MGTPLGPEYIPYTYMDPLGVSASMTFSVFFFGLRFRAWLYMGLLHVISRSIIRTIVSICLPLVALLLLL